MLAVSLEQMLQQAKEITEISSTPSIIYFDDFVKSLAPLYNRGNLPDEIRIAKDEDSLLAGDREPAMVINLKDNMHLLDYKGMPMWHNQSNDSVSLHGLGLIEGNKSAPSSFTVFDTNPHINIGGATGHGKSVLANSIIVAASLVHPPWLVQFYLSDPKIVEMKPYAMADYTLPHVNCVAATEDPEYAISVLQYLLDVMDKRANIFTAFGVKNIDQFNKTSGLYMPMLVLVLDELKAMLATAGRRAAVVDKQIQAFVAKARFCGGRCIMLSQGVVTQLDPDTMKNVNVRVALGCVPAESEKLIGNPGASVNLGTMGKIVFNNSPEKTLKENVHLTTPFLPDKANKFSNNIYDIFEHQQKVWEQLTYPGARISPMSFFDETAPLTKKEFIKEIKGKVSTDRIFLGEPVYINKSEYKMANTSLKPFDEYSDNLSNNILFLSPYGKHRLNFLATLMANFEELRKTTEIDLRVYSNLNQTNQQIKKFGYQVEGYNESGDVADAFARIVQQTYLRILIIKTDEVVYGEGKEPLTHPIVEKLIEGAEKKFGRISPIMKRRIRVFLAKLDETNSQLIFGFTGKLSNKEEIKIQYANYLTHMIYFYEDFNCKSSQITAANIPIDIRVFFNFGNLTGTETKTNRMMDVWMTVVKQAPVYGVHFVLISDMLPNCGSSLNGNFNKIVFYGPTPNAIAQHKLTDDYPESTLECVYIYADKTKTSNICVKVKLVDMLD